MIEQNELTTDLETMKEEAEESLCTAISKIAEYLKAGKQCEGLDMEYAGKLVECIKAGKIALAHQESSTAAINHHNHAA